MNFLKAMFGNYSKREVKRVQPICDKVLALEDKYAAMSESELKNQTTILKERLANGETTDDILPEAFATCREAGWRVLGMKHFPVQIIGGIVLHQGRIAEMKTGEGKTLVATLPAYLNALTGEGVHIVTVNDYLARRDSEWMGKLYRYLGLSVGLICHDLDNEGRKKAYAADITYGTNNELGFDYLRDNMVVYKENKVQRPHAFAIVDEVDSILIDEARTPLIISGKGDKSTDLYAKADAFAKTLKVQRFAELDAKEDMEEYYKENDIDYVVDEKQKTATLTQSGVKKAEEFFGIENLTDPDNLTIQHHVNQAIKANGVMKLDVDYVVKDDAFAAFKNGVPAIGELDVESVAGTTGNTVITVSPKPIGGHKLVYKTAASTAPSVAYDDDLSKWTEFNNGDEITATNGHKITVAEVTADGKARKSGSADVVSGE